MTDNEIWTRSEREEKKYTIQHAIDAAKQVLNARLPGTPICMSSLKGVDVSVPITMVALNNIKDLLIEDTFFFDEFHKQKS